VKKQKAMPSFAWKPLPSSEFVPAGHRRWAGGALPCDTKSRQNRQVLRAANRDRSIGVPR
jgi:hypothetical protein